MTIPVTFLSGFLGAGKTTLVTQILSNAQGIKVGVVVNDVAKVNIDAKLIQSDTRGQEGLVQFGTVELQNGCACCSASMELWTSIATLLGNERSFDHIVVECSGVANPKSILENFNIESLGGPQEVSALN